MNKRGLYQPPTCPAYGASVISLRPRSFGEFLKILFAPGLLAYAVLRVSHREVAQETRRPRRGIPPEAQIYLPLLWPSVGLKYPKPPFDETFKPAIMNLASQSSF